MGEGSLFYFLGEETFLMQEKIDSMSIQYSDRELYEGKGADLNKILFSLNNGSLFSTKKFILIKNPVFLIKGLEDAQLGLFQEVLSAVSHTSHCVVIALMGEKADQRKKVFQVLKKKALVTEFQPFKDWEQEKIMAWIRSKVDALGFKIDMNALLGLFYVGGTNLQCLSSEIQKLCVYLGQNKEITLKDIHAVSGGASARWFSFNESIKEKRLADMLSSGGLLLESGEDPVRIMASIHSTIRFYIQMLLMVNDRKDAAQIGSSLGKNPYFVKQMLPFVRKHYTFSGLMSFYDLFNQRDFELKSGALSPEVALELVLIELCR